VWRLSGGTRGAHSCRACPIRFIAVSARPAMSATTCAGRLRQQGSPYCERPAGAHQTVSTCWCGAVGHLPLWVRPTLVIAGTGPEEPRLRRLAAACAVDLRLPGLLSPTRLAEWHTAADLFDPSMPVHCQTAQRGLAASLSARRWLRDCNVVASAEGACPSWTAASASLWVAPDDPSASLRRSFALAMA